MRVPLQRVAERQKSLSQVAEQARSTESLKNMHCKHHRYGAVVLQSLHVNSCQAFEFIPSVISELRLDSQPTF